MNGGPVRQIRKRDGSIVPFEEEKIARAIGKAFAAVGEGSGEIAAELAHRTATMVSARFPDSLPRVEDVQDIVEQVLMAAGYPATAKAYILYRQHRAEVRRLKQSIGVQDDLKLSVNAIKVLERRYLLKDENGAVIETPAQMFHRVARAVASAEVRFNPAANAAFWEDQFYDLMAGLEFLPNSPTLMNAGAPLGQLSACFVLPVEDSIVEIFESLKSMAIIHQSGGGTGFSFTNLMPKGDIVL